MLDKIYYRANAQCDKCGTIWLLRARTGKPKRPARCKFCNSSTTRLLNSWEVLGW